MAADGMDAATRDEGEPEETIVDVLQRVFQYFTSFGDRKNTQYMTDFKFYKLLRHAKLMVRAGREGDERLLHRRCCAACMRARRTPS